MPPASKQPDSEKSILHELETLPCRRVCLLSSGPQVLQF
jgi:hypothetical protein